MANLRKILEQILALLQDLRGSVEELHVEHDEEMAVLIPKPVPQSDPHPIPQPTKTNREILYDVAKGCIGISMVSKDVPIDLGCASSLNNVFKKAFGTEAGGGASTANMLTALLKDKRFQEFKTPLPGDIVLNATGTSTKGVAHGHVGIRGNTDTMSNNSDSGIWDARYTNAGWEAFFAVKEGFKSRYFRVL